jgi:hypothetical protein
LNCALLIGWIGEAAKSMLALDYPTAKHKNIVPNRNAIDVLSVFLHFIRYLCGFSPRSWFSNPQPLRRLRLVAAGLRRVSFHALGRSQSISFDSPPRYALFPAKMDCKASVPAL